jgi:photosystem II stability/assembly factor-like uncharacterized protein
MSEEPLLNGRSRRAVPLVAAALTVAVVAGLLWLRPQIDSGSGQLTFAVPSPTAPTLAAQFQAEYFFVAPGVGWALVEGLGRGPSRYWVFETSDGAQHWTEQFSGSIVSVGYLQLAFFDAHHGYFCVGADGAYRTSDGGRHWTRLALPARGAMAITFSDAGHGWYDGFTLDPTTGGTTNHFFTTTDGGDHWRELPPLPGFGTLVFNNASDGWLVSPDQSGGLLYMTHDGGVTWEGRQFPPGAELGAFGKPQVVSNVRLIPGGGVMVGANNAAYVSMDGGATWRLVGVPVNAVDYHAVTFQDANHWWSMGSGDLYKSDDAGRHWHHVALQLDDWDYIIGVLDSRHAWARLEVPFPRTRQAIGSGLALSSDGGVHWTYVNVPHPA